MGPRCEINAEEQVFGMTVDMQKQIRCRKKPNPGQTEHEKWEQIYRILFPGEDVPDPCMFFLFQFMEAHSRLLDFEPVLDHDAGRPQSPDSVNISQYEAYLRRILPQYVRNALEEAVNSEIQPIEAQIQRRMMEIIQDAQNRAFMSFRNNRISEYESRSPTEMQTDMASIVEDQTQASIETFFHAPPPVNTESFTNLPAIEVSQRLAGQNELSNSGYASHPSMTSTSHHASSDRSENYDQPQTDSVPMDSTTSDISQLLKFNETEEPSGSNWSDIPQTHSDLDDNFLNDFTNSTYHQDAVTDYLGVQSESTLQEKPWYLDPDFMDTSNSNTSEWDSNPKP
jgi:hypothetical protein